MRKLNAILGVLMLALLLIHGIAGAYQLLGIFPGGNTVLQVLAWILIGLIAGHAAIGIYLTADTLRREKRAGVSYRKGNRLFWARRISGFAIILFLAFHVFVFLGRGSGSAYRLRNFGAVELAAHILLAAAIAVHLLTNIRPLLISFGIAGREYVKDILWILAIVLLACGAAFVFYYLRWNVFWQYG